MIRSRNVTFVVTAVVVAVSGDFIDFVTFSFPFFFATVRVRSCVLFDRIHRRLTLSGFLFNFTFSYYLFFIFLFFKRRGKKKKIDNRSVKREDERKNKKGEREMLMRIEGDCWRSVLLLLLLLLSPLPPLPPLVVRSPLCSLLAVCTVCECVFMWAPRHPHSRT